MDFAVRKDARKWFDSINKDLELEFDIFYFCFLAGLATGRKKTLPAAQTDGLVDNFPGNYGQHRELLVALFLCRELATLGIEMDEGHDVHLEIAKLIDPTAPNRLSDDGVRLFNQYSHGGYEVLLEWFDYKPVSLPIFLRIFHQKISETGLMKQRA